MTDAADHSRIQQLTEENAALRHQLMESQKLSSVGVLASSITHEFNNILTTVINYAKMGLRHRDDTVREKSFNKILAAGQRAARITTGMLSYARSSGSRQEPQDLVELMEDVLVLVEKDLQVHRISVDRKFEGHPQASVNASQIQQVLLNLIINARQAMEPGGLLTLGIAHNSDSGFVEVSVRDSGSGIPAEKLPQIFDPFFSTKQADGQGQGGTGLGLSLCREIIESHHGRIRVESAIGHGTTFTLKLPAVVASPVAAPASGAERSAAKLSQAG